MWIHINYSLVVNYPRFVLVTPSKRIISLSFKWSTKPKKFKADNDPKEPRLGYSRTKQKNKYNVDGSLKRLLSHFSTQRDGVLDPVLPGIFAARAVLK